MDEQGVAVFDQLAAAWRDARATARGEVLGFEELLAPVFPARLPELDPRAVGVVLLTVSSLMGMTPSDLEAAGADAVKTWSQVLGLLGQRLYSRDG